MAMVVGDAALGTGMAGAIKAALLANDSHGNGTAAIAGNTLNAFCNQLAGAIVTYIQSNADVTIANTVGSLQTSTTAGNPTNAPAFSQTIPHPIT